MTHASLFARAAGCALLAVVYGVTSSSLGAASPEHVWSWQFNGVGNGNDRAHGVAVDGNGDVYVAGVEDASGVAQGFNWRMCKLSGATGNTVWMATYNGPANGNDELYGVHVDPTGAAIFVGGEDRSDVGEGRNWLIRKYSSLGNLQWSLSYNGAGNGDDRAHSVAYDGTNYVVVGSEDRQGDLAEDLNWLMRKYTSSGALVWSRSFNGPADEKDEATGVALDSAGNVLVVGYTSRMAGDRLDCHIHKRTPDGALLWSRTTNYTWDATKPNEIDMNTSNQYVVAGFWRDATENWRIDIYSPTDTVVWSQTYTIGSPCRSNDAAICDDGGTVAVGFHYGQGMWGTTSYVGEWLMERDNSSGTQIWSRTYTDVTISPGMANAVALAGSAEFVVVGFEDRTDLGQDCNWLVAKFTGGCSQQGSTPTDPEPPPPDPVEVGEVKIVGGIRGYIDPKRGEKATILVKPNAAGQITVRIYNLRGQLLRTLSKSTDGGQAEILHWDGKDESGAAVAPGLYPTSIVGPGVSVRKKLAVMR